jgi:phospholipid/cholesterol/gamma-HCH transport system substrate-binding protein
MESTLKHQIKVGIFATIGLVMFCLSVILLGGDKFFLKKTYELKVRLPQVQGLGRGSVVSLSGVVVGNVTDITFIDKSTDVAVHMNIEAGVQPRITEGSKVTVKTQGALGDKYIYIEPGPVDATALKAGAIVETDKTPDFLDVISARGAEIGQVVEVIKEVRELFQNINQDGKSRKLMGNLVASTETLNQFLTEGREAFKTMNSVMKKVDKGTGTLGALVNDPSLHNRMTSFMGEAPRNKFLKPLIRDSIQTNEQKK